MKTNMPERMVEHIEKSKGANVSRKFNERDPTFYEGPQDTGLVKT